MVQILGLTNMSTTLYAFIHLQVNFLSFLDYFVKVFICIDTLSQCMKFKKAADLHADISGSGQLLYICQGGVL